MILNGLVLAASSTAGRLLGTMGMFALVARGIGPGEFADFLYYYTIGVLVGTLSDYGFATQVLKECSGGTPAEAQPVAKGLFAAKCLATVLAISAAFAYVAVTTPAEAWPGAALIVAAGGAASLIDFSANLLKARLLFVRELLLTGFNSVVCNLAVGLCAFLTHQAVLAAVLLLLGRVICVGLALLVIRKSAFIHLSVWMKGQWTILATQLRRGVGYAVDSISIQGFVALDTFVAKHMFAKVDAGIYISGTRLTQAALAGHGVVTSVFMPSMGSGNWYTKQNLKKLAALSCITMGIGTSIWLMFYLMDSLLPTLLFGEQFATLAELMPYMGSYVFFRYINIPPSSWLVMHGHNRLKGLMSVASLLGAVAYIYAVPPASTVILIQIMCATVFLNTLCQYIAWIILSKMSAR